MRLLVFASWLAAVLLAPPASAAPPAGQSALLNGLHDIEAETFMKTATSGCDKGWITDLQYIGTSGTPTANCRLSATQAGLSIIQRLDASGSESFPKSSVQASGYASAFAAFVSQCPNIHVWIVGNEPNFTFNKSDPDCSAEAYAVSYAEVHKKVHALPGHAQDLVLVAPNSPYSPGCLESLRQIIDRVQKKGVKPDGFALHAYTQVGSGSQLTSSSPKDTKTVNDTTVDECTGGATWNDTWHWHFHIYKDYITQVIEKKGFTGAPVFITESGNACSVSTGNACYPNADVGYFQALYAEAAAWNKTAKTLIRAITPYRYTKNDDGTGRDFAIGDRPLLLQDLKKAFAQKYAWTPSGCAQPGVEAGLPIKDKGGSPSKDLGDGRRDQPNSAGLDHPWLGPEPAVPWASLDGGCGCALSPGVPGPSLLFFVGLLLARRLGRSGPGRTGRRFRAMVNMHDFPSDHRRGRPYATAVSHGGAHQKTLAELLVPRPKAGARAPARARNRGDRARARARARYARWPRLFEEHHHALSPRPSDKDCSG